MHTIKLLLTYNLNISYKRQIYQIAESNRNESKLFCPNWKALASMRHAPCSAIGSFTSEMFGWRVR